MSEREDGHQEVSNTPEAQEAVDSVSGEGDDEWEPGEHARLGLETVPGWQPKTRYKTESGGGLRGIDSLLPAAQGYRDEVVVGGDDRVRVHESHRYPWRTVCALRIYAPDGEVYVGSAWIVGPRTLITAGHCVYLPEMGGWAEQIEIVPGQNGTDRPYGTYVATDFKSVRGWTVDGLRDHDYAAIHLPEDQPLPKLGRFGYGVFDQSALRGSYLNLSGYPIDKDEGTTQWWMARSSSKVDKSSIWYDIDTAAGQSGAPVWRLDPRSKRRLVVGIHTNGSTTGNSALRITREVFQNIKGWTK